MVHAVDLAQQQSLTTPQLSFGQDGVTVQQPVITNPQNGITSGGNQFKVNQNDVVLGNVGTGGSVQVSPPNAASNEWCMHLDTPVPCHEDPTKG
jgi:hypothetical protein